MESILRSVDSRVKSVRLDSSASFPSIAVDLGLSERLPLAQAGQGLYRLVAILSEILSGKAKLFLVDEIENGLHYTALEDLWKGIALAASRLDLQIFATTHSRECLAAAHEAFSKQSSYDLRVVQLFRLQTKSEGRVLERNHIEAALEADIEVRS